METAFIITDKNKMPYAVVSILKGGTEFHPLSENAKTWSGWMNDEYAVRQVSKGQLTATLDNSMSVEGPIAYARNNKLRLDELIAKAKKIPVVEQIEGKKSVDELHVISILDAQLHQLDDSEWHNAIQFKAGAFVADSNKASMNFEVKRTRALWDAGLSIPGTNRRGGWRCPPGMAFGGQITDRFGRNCGAGLARRLANGLQNVGERIENADDAKRGKRVARRNAAMGRRLAGAGAIERGAGRIADALETNLPKAPAGRVVGAPVRKIRGAGVVERGAGRLADALETKPPKVRGAGRIERGAGRLADALETKPPKRTRIGRIERGAGRLADALETRPPKVKPKRTIVGEADKTPIRDNAIRRGLRDIAPDLMAYAEGAEAGVRGRRNPVYEGTPEKLPSGGVRKPKAPRAAAATAKPRKPRVAPVAPKAPKAPKEPKLVDDVSVIPVPKGLPKDGESLSDYMTRKYNEHQEQIRLIQKAGGKAGFLKRPEWDRFHGPDVEANWKKKNAGRAARATASDAKVPKKPAAPRKPAAPKKPSTPVGAFGNDGKVASMILSRDFVKMDDAEFENFRSVAQKFNDEGKSVGEVHMKIVNAEVKRREKLKKAVEAKPPTPSPVITPPPAPKKPRARKGSAIRPVNLAEDRHDKSLPLLGDENGQVKRVPVGSGGINSAQQARVYKGSLADVPDDYIIDALIAQSVNRDSLGLGLLQSREFDERMKGVRTNPSSITAADKALLKEQKDKGKNFYLFAGQSITAPSFYMKINDDGSLDGRGYLHKPQDPDAAGRGQHAELLGIEIARRMGFAQSAPRVIEKNGPSVSLLLELGPNLAKGHVKPFKKSEVDDDRSRLGHFVVNMLLGAGDRHGNNGMHFVGDGALPIDFGRAFENKVDASPENMAQYLGNFSMLDNKPLSGYAVSLQNGKTVAEIKQQIKQDLIEWKAQISEMFEDGTYDSFQVLVPNNASGNGRWLPVSKRKQYIKDRLALLDSDEFINELWRIAV